MTDAIAGPNPVAFTVEHREPGYKNSRISGTYIGSATVEDVKKQFFHSYFGGREAWIKDGRFGCVVHLD